MTVWPRQPATSRGTTAAATRHSKDEPVYDETRNSPNGTPDISTMRRKAITASFIGNCIEWFDYGTYGYLATMIAVAFFPETASTTGLLATLEGFAAPVIARPVG